MFDNLSGNQKTVIILALMVVFLISLCFGCSILATLMSPETFVATAAAL